MAVSAGLTSTGSFSVHRGHQSRLQGYSSHMALTFISGNCITQSSINPFHDAFYSSRCQITRMDDVWDRATTVGDCLCSAWDGTQALLLPWQHKKTNDTPLPHPPYNSLMKSLHACPLSEDQQTAQSQITNWWNAAMRHCPHGSTCADGATWERKIIAAYRWEAPLPASWVRQVISIQQLPNTLPFQK